MGAGLLNYLFQIYAARTLSGVEFGQWSGWLAQFSVSLFIALWVQSLMAFRRNALPELSRVRLLTVFVALSLLSAGAIASEVAFLNNAMGWLWTVLSSAFFGILLAERRLILLSVVTLLTVASKFAVAFALPTPDGFTYGVLYGPIAALLIYAWVGLPASSTTIRGVDRRRALLLSSFFFSLATAITPQLDLLVAQIVLSPEALGGFAKVALLYKGFFFLFMILAQVVMTYQVRGAFFHLPGRWLFVIYAAGGILAWGLSQVVSIEMVPPVWLIMAMVHIVSLTILFLLTQQAATQQRWRWPAVLSAALCVELILARLIHPELTTFMLSALLIETLLLLAYFWFSRRSSPAR